MNKEELKITKEDLALWLDRPPSNDDLDLCAYLEKALENQHNYYQEIKQLQQVNKQLKSNWNKLKECLKDVMNSSNDDDKEFVETILDIIQELEKRSDSNG